MNIEEINSLTNRVIAAAIEVHSVLGPGLLESAYHQALLKELELRGIKAQKEVPLPIFYKGYRLESTYRVDILVEDELILELKASDPNPYFAQQLLTYLRLSNKEVGLLLNFKYEKMKDGIQRLRNFDCK